MTGSGGTTSQEVTITVTGTNDAPVISSRRCGDSGSVTESVVIPVDVAGINEAGAGGGWSRHWR